MARLAPDDLIFPCNCGDGDHYLRVTWDEDYPEYRALWIESHQLIARQTRLRTRLRRAWKLIRGTGYQPAEIVLTDEHLTALTNYLTGKVTPNETIISRFMHEAAERAEAGGATNMSWTVEWPTAMTAVFTRVDDAESEAPS